MIGHQIPIPPSKNSKTWPENSAYQALLLFEQVTAAAAMSNSRIPAPYMGQSRPQCQSVIFEASAADETRSRYVSAAARHFQSSDTDLLR